MPADDLDPAQAPGSDPIDPGTSGPLTLDDGWQSSGSAPIDGGTSGPRTPGDDRQATSSPGSMSIDPGASGPLTLTEGWQAPTAPPARDRDDELLQDPPKQEHGGRLAGYAAGSRMRILLFTLVVVFVAGGVALVMWFVRNREPEHPQQFQLPEGSELSSRPRTMVWSGGVARLGLDRRPPGLLAVELPDRTLRLADGCDQAQFKVDVEDGRTRTIKVLFGEVVEELAPGARPKLKPAE